MANALADRELVGFADGRIFLLGPFLFILNHCLIGGAGPRLVRPLIIPPSIYLGSRLMPFLAPAFCSRQSFDMNMSFDIRDHPNQPSESTTLSLLFTPS